MDGVNRIRVSIARCDLSESLVADYLSDSKRNTKQLCMDSWLTYYLPLALLDHPEASDSDIIEATLNSVVQLRAQIDKISLALQVRGIDLPAAIYAAPVDISSTRKQKSLNPTKVKKTSSIKLEPLDDDWGDEEEFNTDDEQSYNVKD